MKKYLAITCLALLIGISINSCGKKAGPEAVADKFLTHLSKGEFEKASEYATEQTRQMLSIAAAFSDMGLQESKKHENLTCEVTDDKATCTYYIEGEMDTIDLVYQEGKWLVDQKK